MYFEAYRVPVHLSCTHFDFCCCSSCHEDVYYDFPLIEIEHPKNSSITAEVCCGVVNALEGLDIDEVVMEWEKALQTYTEGGIFTSIVITKGDNK